MVGERDEVAQEIFDAIGWWRDERSVAWACAAPADPVLFCADDSRETLLGGSFNNVPTSDLYQIVSQSFSDPFAGQAVEKTITWRLVNQIVSRVDYLWLHGINSLGAGIVPVAASTHDLAVVEISLTPAGS